MKNGHILCPNWLSGHRKSRFSDGLGGGYSYLAIGNSITVHEINDYWFAEYGMAASIPSKDYFHIVMDDLEQHYENVVSKTYNFISWETLSTDRAETIALLDGYLNPYLDLVTIQLGENVNDLTTFESDFRYLIEHIQEVAPDAKIIVITDFWNMEGRDEAKIRAANKCQVAIADISDIKGNKDYMIGKGVEVYGDDGETHIVSHDGVSKHPGDNGMQFIADQVIRQIKYGE